MQAIWTPTPEQLENANLRQFRRQINSRHSLNLPDYESLYRWSIEHPAAFWEAVADFAEVKFSQHTETICSPFK